MTTNLHNVHPDSNPFTELQAQKIFDETDITDSDTCNWAPDVCQEPAVRLGIFTLNNKNFTIKYLCERHKIMGLEL